MSGYTDEQGFNALDAALDLHDEVNALKRERTALVHELSNISIQMQEYCRIHDRPCELGLPSFALLYARVADVVHDVRRLEAENTRLREQLDAIDALHLWAPGTPTDYCRCCAAIWPCATHRILHPEPT